MSTTWRLLRPALREAVRGRWLVGGALGLALVGELLLRFAGSGVSSLVSLLDVVLILVPLAGLVVGTMQVHHARELIELLLAQPIARARLFAGLWLGIALPLALALAVGLVTPFAIHGLLVGALAGRVAMLVAVATLLVAISTAFAFVIALRQDDRVRALSVALGLWLVTAVLWDGAALAIAMLFGTRPIEGPLLAMLALNPVDIARVLLLLGSDTAAMLGATGAVLARTLGGARGQAVLVLLLVAWVALPIWWSARTFARKDF
jgi:Cu-processing system permease protein